MGSTLRIAAFVMAAGPAASAQARDAKVRPASPRDRAATEAARTFADRMHRLDASMGGVPERAGSTRARSDEAGQ